MKKNHFYHFALLLLLCLSTTLFASAQNTKLIRVTIPGQAAFECTHANGPTLTVNNVRGNNGRTERGTVTIVKNIDKSEAELNKIKTGNKILPSVEIEYYKKSPKGEMSKYGSIKLSNALISSVELKDNKQCEIKFIYQKIEWTWTDGGTSTSDDWEATD
jgi:type VI protein secretion system component Hcp